MDLEDTGTRVKNVLHDRDASFTAASGAVFQAASVRIVRSAVQAPRMNSVMQRWIGRCRHELLDHTLIWTKRHPMISLREYEDFYNTHRPHRTLKQAAPLRLLPDSVTDLNHSRVQRHDRAEGLIHEYHLVTQVSRHPQATDHHQAHPDATTTQDYLPRDPASPPYRPGSRK